MSGAIFPVPVVGIYCVRSYTFGTDAGQFLMTFNAILEPYAPIERLERMMPDGRYAVNPDIVEAQ